MALPYDRVFNFSAGPGTLPVAVLEQAREEMLNYHGTGMSVMEMSHRSKAFEAIIQEAEQDLRTLLAVPDGYKVLFLQGGASLQFSMVPMCFLSEGKVADYVVTGSWGKKAVESGNLVGQTKVIWDGKADNYRSVPDMANVGASPNAAYLHFTSNETIQGVQFTADPRVEAPLICDMSSDILSRPADVSRYALIYAGAQKNMGPAGVTVVIIRDDLVANVPEKMHPMLDYRLHVEHASLYNTPPCWSIYIVGLVYKHLLANGGLAAMQMQNDSKAQLLYEVVDNSNGFYRGHAETTCRSTMNVTFTLAQDDLTDSFIKEAQKEGLDGLKGHRSVGGCRASIYNAFPPEGCGVLAQFMKDFAQRNA